jgi:nitrate reductase gamma subunit
MFFGASYWLAARPLGWLAGLGIVFLGHGLGVIEIPFPFASAEVFGRNVPDLVAWSFGAVLFGIGFGAITGAAILWIRRKPKDALTGESS